jgi:hypothetical protein
LPTIRRYGTSSKPVKFDIAKNVLGSVFELHKNAWLIETVAIKGPDDLREPFRGSDVEVVQLKPGKLQGSVKHFGIGNLGICLGRFSREMRFRGALDQERVVIGTYLDSLGPITQWRKEMRPGDIGVSPALAEFDAIYSGGASYLAVSISVPELLSMLASEEHLADSAFWNTNRLCNKLLE